MIYISPVRYLTKQGKLCQPVDYLKVNYAHVYLTDFTDSNVVVMDIISIHDSMRYNMVNDCSVDVINVDYDYIKDPVKRHYNFTNHDCSVVIKTFYYCLVKPY